MKRREFLKVTAAAGLSVGTLSACGGDTNAPQVTPKKALTPLEKAQIKQEVFEEKAPQMPPYAGPNPFRHGVASGDPLAHQVIFWTRITAPELDEIPVILVVATDPALKNVIYKGVEYARSTSDYTVKFDPLVPYANTTYYYQFETLGYRSPIGRSKTIPEAGDASAQHARIAVVACSNYPQGYFNVYRKVAQRADLDIVLHLGDYIYEYPQGEYSDPALHNERPVDPPHDIVTLEDYRRRYALYRTDADLQECHRQHPFICVWDDHEIADNSWRDGANNHSPDQGDYHARKRAAIQAYHEWLPIRRVMPDDYIKIYRSFDYGQLFTLMMLDTRLIGRDEQATLPHETRNTDRHLLGQEQEKWLFDELDRSQGRSAKWHILGQQIMLSPLTLGSLPDMPNLPLGGGIKINYDQWDGYQASRRKLLSRIEAMALDNAVILIGDIHSSWAMDVSLDPGNIAKYTPHNGNGSLAVEFVTPAVSSPAAPTKGLSDIAFALLATLNPHMKWVDLYHRGYIVLDVTPEHCKADWFHVDTVQKIDDNERFARSYFTEDGRNRVTRTKTPSAPKAFAPALAPSSTEAM